MDLFKKIIIFCKERFPFEQYAPMVLMFSTAHVLYHDNLEFSLLNAMIVSLLCLVFFFKLRIYDEIKDYEHDIVHNPTRPLARKLFKVSEFKLFFKVCIFIELSLCFFISTQAMLWMLMTCLYSLFMYKEFFIGEFLRDKLTTYALSHTIVTVLLSMTILECLRKFNFYEDFLWCFSHWFVFNVFEFVRKTFSKEDDKRDELTYSNIFGLFGACVLSLSNILLAVFFMGKGGALSFKFYIFNFAFIVLSTTSIFYVCKLNDLKAVKKYRFLNTLFVPFIYLTFIGLRIYHDSQFSF